MSQSDAHVEFDVFDLLDLGKSGGNLDPILRLGGGSAGGAAMAFGQAGAVVEQDHIAIDILLAAGVDEAFARASLEAAGMVGVHVDGRAASGWIDADTVTVLEDIATIDFARATYAFAQTGSVGAEGSLSINADAARDDFGVDGSGISVGVLSDSFNTLGGYNADRASGDLPDVTVLQDSFGTDEGRAMLQIVHDVAPGAELMFHTANGGQAAFAAGIEALAAAGADVIVDDIVYLAEPFFQDGLVARAVDAVFEEGVAYFSSAGNSARDSYEAAFNGSGSDLVLSTVSGDINLGEMHDFDIGAGTDVTQRIVVPQGRDMFVSFQWDQPFASVSADGRGSQSDLDILLFRGGAPRTLDNLVAVSAGGNVGGDPVEVFRFVNNTDTTQFDLVITSFSGPEPGLMKYVELGAATIAEHDTNSDTSFGHAPAEGGLGVGAAFWGLTPNFGQADPVLEGFSSAGPASILFDDDGVRLTTPELRASPDLVGPDGTNNTFFGTDIGFDADTDPNFFGTSAAAPHVAAVAALLLEVNPSLSPQQVYDILQSTAIDMGAVGFDDESGAGLVDARAAVAEALEGEFAPLTARNSVGTSGNDRLNGGAGNDAMSGRAGQDTLFGFDGDDRLNGGEGADVMRGGAGADIYAVDNVNDVVIETNDSDLDRINVFVDFTNPENVEFLVGLFASTGLRLTGNDGQDRIAGSNLIASGDSIGGMAGNDKIVGLVGDDRIDGGAGNDRIFGNSGDDMIRGGAGNDRLTGQFGQDTFFHRPGHGRDRITDFDSSEDRLDLTFHEFAGFADVQAALSDVAGGALLDFGGGESILFEGLTVAGLSLDADDVLL